MKFLVPCINVIKDKERHKERHTLHKERPRVCKKKDDGNGVAGKEEKRETKEKVFGYGEKGYGGGWCEGDKR